MSAYSAAPTRRGSKSNSIDSCKAEVFLASAMCSLCTISLAFPLAGASKVDGLSCRCDPHYANCMQTIIYAIFAYTIKCFELVHVDNWIYISTHTFYDCDNLNVHLCSICFFVDVTSECKLSPPLEVELLPLHLSIYLCISLSLYIYIYIYMNPSMNLWIYPSIHPSLCVPL